MTTCCKKGTQSKLNLFTLGVEDPELQKRIDEFKLETHSSFAKYLCLFATLVLPSSAY